VTAQSELRQRSVEAPSATGGRALEAAAPLALIADKLAVGMTRAEFSHEHPELTVSDLDAAESYARARARGAQGSARFRCRLLQSRSGHPVRQPRAR
jgi:uncharacterized protein (DUF433 family)